MAPAQEGEGAPTPRGTQKHHPSARPPGPQGGLYAMGGEGYIHPKVSRSELGGAFPAVDPEASSLNGKVAGARGAGARGAGAWEAFGAPHVIIGDLRPARPQIAGGSSALRRPPLGLPPGSLEGRSPGTPSAAVDSAPLGRAGAAQTKEEAARPLPARRGLPVCRAEGAGNLRPSAGPGLVAGNLLAGCWALDPGLGRRAPRLAWKG